MAHKRHEEVLENKTEAAAAYGIRKPKVAILLGIVLAFWGLLSAFAIPKESAPYIEFGIVNVSTTFIGASAIDIDSLITQEIESKIEGISGLNKYTSVSRNSVSNITLEFEPGQDMTKAVGDVRSKVDEAKPGLPSEIESDPFIQEIDSSLQPFVSVVLSGPHGPAELRDFAEDLKERLTNVPDVARVNISGGAEREVSVKVDKRRLESLGLTLDDVTNAIRLSHRDTPIGDFEIDRLNYSLRFTGKHKTADDVKLVVLKNLKREGTPSLVTVGDVATVSERAEDNNNIYRFVALNEEQKTDIILTEKVRYFISRIGRGFQELSMGIIILSLILTALIALAIAPPNVKGTRLPRFIPILLTIVYAGIWFFAVSPPPEYATHSKTLQNAVEIQLARKSESDILAVNDRAITAATEFANDNLPKDIQIDFVQNEADIMRDDYRSVIQSALQSFVIVMLFIFFFVGVMEGLVASIVIPITFLVTIGVLNLMGKTLNFMTNFSMILSLGILVDTAIVIVEGTHHFIKQGYKPREAAMLSLHEYRAPLIAGTLTTLAVFIPLLSLSGILGQYLSFIPITVIIVISVALLISLLLLPAYASQLIPAKREEAESRSPSRIKLFARNFRKQIDGLINGVIDRYGRMLGRFLRHRSYRLGAFTFIFVLFLASFFVPLKFELFPSGDSPFISVSIEMPEGTVTERTEMVANVLENYLVEQPEVLFLRTNVAEKTATTQVELLPVDQREELSLRTAQELQDDVTIQLESVIERAGGSIRVQAASNGPPSEFPVAFRVIIRDRNLINQAQDITRQLTEMMKTIPGTSGVKNDVERIPGEFRFTVDREKAISLGVEPSQVAGLVRTALQGTTAATITRGGRDIDIVVEYAENDVKKIEDIENFKIFTVNGSPVLLNQVLKIDRQDALAAVRRSDGDIAFTVSSLLGPNGNAQQITLAFQEKIDAGIINIPNGIEIINAGENQENANLISELRRGLAIAILLMFLILVIQSNAFLQPILVLFTILFSQIGVTLGLWLTGTPRSLAYILGVIALAGIVVNDAIIMIDQMNKNRGERRDAGEPNILESIVESGKSRFIPVVLTTLTTSAGIIPLIFQDQFWAGLSYTVIFGLMVASSLTLVITPAMYYQIEKETGLTISYIICHILPLILLVLLFSQNWIGVAVVFLLLLFFIFLSFRFSGKLRQQEMRTAPANLL